MSKLNPLHIYGGEHVDCLLQAMSDQYQDSYFMQDSLDFAADSRGAENALAVMHESIAEFKDLGFNKIIIHFTFATRLGAHFIHKDGTMEPRKGLAGMREYFDGTIMRIRHASGGCIDLDEKAIFVQEPWGRAFDDDAGRALKTAFNDFSFVDLRLAQQKDYHSCMVLTLDNMEVFAKGRIPKETCDAMAIRARHNEIFNKAGLPHGVMVLNEMGVSRPAFLQRYLP